MGYEDERHWYVVQTYSGFETVAKKNIELRVKSMHMEDYIFNVLVPEVKQVEKNKKGETKETIVKPYPGYVFIEMIATLEAWFMVRNTEKVTGFIGSSGGGTKPVPMQDDEIIPILKLCGIQITHDFPFNEGDEVTVASGTFMGYIGVIDAIDYEKEMVRVLINVFGRQTAVELSFNEVKAKQ